MRNLTARAPAQCKRREKEMFRRSMPGWCLAGLAALGVVLLAGGCSHDVPTVAAGPPDATVVGTQPYSLVDQLPPKPRTVVLAHRELTCVHHSDGYYLAARDGHCYHAGRDAYGHLFPVYYDSLRCCHRLYYDCERDNYYWVG